jgi:hypothetical protein
MAKKVLGYSNPTMKVANGALVHVETIVQALRKQTYSVEVST